MCHKPFNFHICDHHALRADGVANLRVKEEHITATQQVLCSACIEHHAAIHTRGNGKCQTGWEVRLNETRHHICGWTLCGNYQMDASGTGHLCQTHKIMLS